MFAERLHQCHRTSLLPRLRFMMAKISDNHDKKSGCSWDRNVRACWIVEKIERMEGGLTSVMKSRRSRELKQQPAEVITQLVPLFGATEQARLLL